MCVTLSLQNLIKIDLSYQLIMNIHIYICIYIIFYLGMPPSMCYRFHHKIKLLSLVLSLSLSTHTHARTHNSKMAIVSSTRALGGANGAVRLNGRRGKLEGRQQTNASKCWTDAHC